MTASASLFCSLIDYTVPVGAINALYLTPISRSQNT
jgi:hypothetical protein